MCLLAIDGKLRTISASKLILDWSPEQISAWLKVRYPSNESMRVPKPDTAKVFFIDLCLHPDFGKICNREETLPWLDRISSRDLRLDNDPSKRGLQDDTPIFFVSALLLVDDEQTAPYRLSFGPDRISSLNFAKVKKSAVRKSSVAAPIA